MPDLKNKTILLISPQSWGKMFISKHHYAIELAKYGNRVYFLNPPEPASNKEKIRIEPSEIHPELFLIHHQLSFPYNIKFHLISLFHLLMRGHMKQVLKKIERPVDIIWSFDLGHLYPFRIFPAQAYKIFHPVDEPLTKAAIQSAEGSEIIFSVTYEILEKYKSYPAPKHFINHGVSEVFLEKKDDPFKIEGIVRVGFSGNLMRNDIDREIFLKIIRENPEIIFECWGSYQVKDDNVGGGTGAETFDFVNQLQNSSNVILHGAVAASVLASEFRRMDAFLICYDVERDQSRGTNYHKVMEYLAIGKVIISNNITTYQSRPELVTMVDERTDNNNMPYLFKEVTSRLDEYNNAGAVLQRQEFAAGNTYKKQIAVIEEFVSA